MKINALLLLPAALLAIIVITHKPQSETYHWQSSITHASLHDSLPDSYLLQVKPKEIQGYQVSKSIHENIYYFEYTARHEDVLKGLSMLPFHADSLRADVQSRIIAGTELTRIRNLLRDSDIIRSVDQPNLDEYAVFECLKTPQHHFVLLHRTSDRVIHIIQQV